MSAAAIDLNLSRYHRLITERGTFGSNLDVLTPGEFPGGQIYGGGWGGGGPRPGAATNWALVELVLDLVILEDGLCPGTDTCSSQLSAAKRFIT